MVLCNIVAAEVLKSGRKIWQPCSILTAHGLLSPSHQRRFSQEPASGNAGQTVVNFCVVGSGPAGFYTADRLLKRFGDRVHIDILDRLPTPFGLVRSGVAPDHQDTKNVINQFTKIAADPRCSFFGNVKVGRDVEVAELQQYYNAVVLAYGAESNRNLDIPGEGLANVLPAREFVWWYNGHPDYARLPIDLSRTTSVVICGLGNVAVDCARILLQPLERRLPQTDIAAHALEVLQKSAVKQLHLVGRRGPAQAQFTPKELRELLNMEGIAVRVRPEAMQLTAVDLAELKASRPKRRICDILSNAADSGGCGLAKKELFLHFLRSPVAIEPKAGTSQAGSVTLERNRLQATSGGEQHATRTGELESVEAQLVLESIGYRSLPLPGVPFDEKRGVVANRDGRVVQGEEPVEGLYCTGWVKRGPTGIIGTNIIDAEGTAQVITSDFSSIASLSAQKPGGRGLAAALDQANVRYITFEDWVNIDTIERERGAQLGKVRDKFVDVADMLKAVNKA